MINDTVSWYNLLDFSLPTHDESHKMIISFSQEHNFGEFIQGNKTVSENYISYKYDIKLQVAYILTF